MVKRANTVKKQRKGKGKTVRRVVNKRKAKGKSKAKAMGKSKAMVKAESKGKFMYGLFGRTRSRSMSRSRSSGIKLPKRLPHRTYDSYLEGYKNEKGIYDREYQQYLNELNDAAYGEGDTPTEPTPIPTEPLSEEQWNLLKKYMDQAQRRRSFRRGSKSMRSRSTGTRTTPGSIRLNIISRLIGEPQERVLQYLFRPHL